MMREEVDNVYYDNIIHISLFKGGAETFLRDFHKQDFTGKSSYNFSDKASWVIWYSMGWIAMVSIIPLAFAFPDSPSSYMVDVIISYSGTLKESTDSQLAYSI